MTSKAEDTAESEDSKKPLSATDPGFRQALRKNRVLDQMGDQFTDLPDQDEIEARLNAPRGSPSPTVSFYKLFAAIADPDDNEASIINVLDCYVLQRPSLDDNLIKEQYRAKVKRQWTDYPKDVGFNNGLSAPKPTYVEGYASSEFPPNMVEIGSTTTLLRDGHRFPVLPHFVMEARAPGEDMNQAETRAQYDGAAMAFCRNEVLEYLQKPDPPETAKVGSVVADGRSYDISLHYAQKDEKTSK